ncbi:MAG TPA: hypothetical protein P5057_10180 [Acidobacteriota bacterium]|nr:hypothetical protein [Acidobacteriota bacterium]
MRLNRKPSGVCGFGVKGRRRRLAGLVGAAVLAASFPRADAWAERPGRSVSLGASVDADRVLYVVSGCPTTNHPLRFPVRLYRLEAGKLRRMREVVAKEVGSDSILSYPGERVLVVIEYNLEEGRDQRIHALFMDKPWEEKSFTIPSCPTCGSRGEGHLFRDGDGRYFAFVFSDVRFSGPGRFLKPRGVDLESGRPVEFSWEIFEKVRVSGTPGVYFPGDWFYLDVGEGGRLSTHKLHGCVVLDWPPVKSPAEPKPRVVVDVVNEAMKVISEMGPPPTPSECRLFILRSGEEEWMTVMFPGNLTRLTAFGPWLTSFEAYKRKGVSPGIEERRQEPTETGFPLDWQLSASGIYLPGIILLYNVEGERLIRYETGQGDSEVLLVEGDTVYYRVNRSIFRAHIGKEGLEKHTRLVEDDVVPDIHWAFFGPPPPVPGGSSR